MSEKFIRAEEVAKVMEISVAYAYKIIRKLSHLLHTITIENKQKRQ